LRVEIDPASPQPPSEQIQDQVRFAVASGRLVPGDRLPSVRGLASQALVNPNTVAKAYRELEREGTVETRPGDGVFVAARATQRCAAMRNRTIGERVRRAVEEAVSSGLEPREVEEIVAEALAAAAEREPEEVRR
jgi:DNA-binding transcriptional regulator YhcF (GntR family)